MTNEEIMAYQADRRAFFETPAGKAMRAHTGAVIRSEQAETSKSLSFKRLNELGDKVRQTEQALIDEIKKLQGVCA